MAKDSQLPQQPAPDANQLAIFYQNYLYSAYYNSYLSAYPFYQMHYPYYYPLSGQPTHQQVSPPKGEQQYSEKAYQPNVNKPPNEASQSEVQPKNPGQPDGQQGGQQSGHLQLNHKQSNDDQGKQEDCMELDEDEPTQNEPPRSNQQPRGDQQPQSNQQPKSDQKQNETNPKPKSSQSRSQQPGKMPSSLKQNARQETPYSRPPSSSKPPPSSKPPTPSKSASSIPSNNDKEYCALCEVYVPNKNAMRGHLVGKNHKLHGSNLQFFCNLCQTEITGLQAFHDHLNDQTTHIEAYENLVSLHNSIGLRTGAEEKQNRYSICFSSAMNGGLHIGHAKEILLIQNLQQTLGGQLIFRIDDHDQIDLGEDCVDQIKQDLAALKVRPDIRSNVSDYFQLCLDSCERLIKLGKAYCEHVPIDHLEKMQKRRIESKGRQNSVEQNLEVWAAMLKGSCRYGMNCCVRAKIETGAYSRVSDPILYSSWLALHPRSGGKYKAYPTYEFAYPIIDSHEAITHSLRLKDEPASAGELYDWVCDSLQLRKPIVNYYSKLQFEHTSLTGNGLNWLLQKQKLSGWDDPRMPTPRGLQRRGLAIEALKEFIIAQHSSGSCETAKWNTLWSINQRVIGRRAHRYMGFERDMPVKVTIENVDQSEIEIVRHPTRPEFGRRKLKVGKKMLISQKDAKRIELNGRPVNFIGLGMVVIVKQSKDNDVVKEMIGRLKSASGDLEKEKSQENGEERLEVAWLEASNVTTVRCYYFEVPFEKPILVDEGEMLSECLNQENRVMVDFLVERRLNDLKKGEIIELSGRGCFIHDSPYESISHKSLDNKPTLFAIPDGTDDLAKFPSAVQIIKGHLRRRIAGHAKNTKENQKKKHFSANK